MVCNRLSKGSKMTAELHPLSYDPKTNTWIAYEGEDVKGTADAVIKRGCC